MEGIKISKSGVVIGKRGKPLKPNISNSGYPRAGKYMIHILLARTYIPNPNNYRYVEHIDENRMNYDLSNLNWTTQRENPLRSVKNGNGRRLLTDEQVRDIRGLLERGYSTRDIANRYGLDIQVVYRLKIGKYYSHIK